MRGDRVGCLPHHSQYKGLPHLHHMLLMCPTWRKRRPVLRVKEHLLQLSWTGMYDVFQLEMLEVIRFPSLLLLSIVVKCFFHYLYIFFCRLLYVKWPFPTTQRQKVQKRISRRVSFLTRKNDKLNEQVKYLQRMVWRLQKQNTRTSKAKKKSAREAGLDAVPDAAPDVLSPDVATPVNEADRSISAMYNILLLHKKYNLDGTVPKMSCQSCLAKGVSVNARYIKTSTFVLHLLSHLVYRRVQQMFSNCIKPKSHLSLN